MDKSIGDPTKAKVIDIPPIQTFRSLGHDRNPINRFYEYLTAIQGISKGVSINPGKIRMNPKDGRELYRQLRLHVEDHFASPDPGTEATKLWDHWGPEVSDVCPMGRLILLEGYVFIKDGREL